MTAVQVLTNERPARAITVEPTGKPEGGLDLRHPCNQKALRQMDWQAISELRGRQPSPSVDDLFLAAVCNSASCPIGWSECRRRDWKFCHYYDLLRTVEAMWHSNPQTNEEINPVKEGDDGRHR